MHLGSSQTILSTVPTAQKKQAICSNLEQLWCGNCKLLKCPIIHRVTTSSSQQAAAKGLQNGLTKKTKRSKDKEPTGPDAKDPES